VRHDPPVVDRVPGEPTRELVVDAATGHGLTGVPRDLEGRRVPGALILPQEEQQRHVRRELGGTTEPTVARIVLPLQRRHGSIEELGRHRSPYRVEALTLRSADRLDHRGTLTHHVVTLVPPRIGDRPDQTDEGIPGVVGAAEERFPFRRGEDGHRPATLAGHRLGSRHVHGVDVGALLTVHFDGYHRRVDDLGRRTILKRLMCHHVAPVACGIAHRDQDRDVPATCLRECLRTPLPPVHGVVPVLEKIGRGRATKPVHPPTLPHHSAGIRNTMAYRSPGGLSLFP
jgi:hypothetical protein